MLPCERLPESDVWLTLENAYRLSSTARLSI